MPGAQRFGREGFLEYNARHKILICRECRYAVQRNALDSHLLKHKIYRNERQRLLSALTELQLPSPDDVALPPSNSPPVDGLPVLAGFRCTVTAKCQHLTASSKRMKRHWSESHHVEGSTASLSTSPKSLARAANLQTFFRGTKVQYFEVKSQKAKVMTTAEEDNLLRSRDSDDDDHDHVSINGSEGHDTGDNGNRGDVEMTELSMYDAVVYPPVPPLNSLDFPPVPTVSNVPVLPNNTEISLSIPSESGGALYSTIDCPDLRGLFYFNHFVHSTCHTLRAVGAIQWDMYFLNDFVTCEWITYGFLAISAIHCDRLTVPRSTSQHSGPMVHYTKEFRKYFNRSESTVMDADARKLASCIDSLLRICMLDGLGPNLSVPMLYHTVLDLEKVFPRARSRPQHGAARHASQHTLPPVLFGILEQLPGLIAEGLEKPDNREDVMAVLSAITAIGRCYSVTSHTMTSSIGESRWQYIRDWIDAVPIHFRKLLWGNHPAAVVVFAHWAAISVRRAEQDGCWFVDGMSSHIVQNAKELLLEDGYPELANLVSCLKNLATS